MPVGLLGEGAVDDGDNEVDYDSTLYDAARRKKEGRNHQGMSAILVLHFGCIATDENTENC